ncbi:multi-sensor hybrid histidine kinase [Fibrisoma limi BUZ 3]|uniref:histidine kinase n=1 Tax=Fibrisoma limi BUZ 3 TaxID=1185876 RepID=I2GML5_9BACT|nr:ATP-binding protein [Fibrisoma limi]CCH55143.1 multi-sensor hybrid histidine kinase [Fibrisoma limi BUZ 3]
MNRKKLDTEAVSAAQEQTARMQAEKMLEQRTNELSVLKEQLLQVSTTLDQLRKSEEKYRGIMNNMDLGLLEVDNDQIIVRAYDRFCQMIGYREDELLGKNASELFVKPGNADVLERQQEKRKHGQSSSYELPLLHKNGHTVWALVSGVPITNEKGQVVGSIGIHYNLTERKQLEQELESARSLAEEARIAENQFLANMSHEMRTPLNAIIGMTNLLYDTSPSVQQQEYLDMLRSSADFLHELVSDLLDMAKIDSARIDVQPEPFNVAGLLETLANEFRDKLAKSSVSFELAIGNGLSDSFVGDSSLLRRILYTLLSNAEKFTEAGLIRLSARLQKQEGNKAWIEFDVADTGMGIPDDKREQIFEKFQQISHLGQKQKGVGIGLTIAKRLVDLQGGQISVQSAVGQGSVFTISLPYVKRKASSQPGTPESAALVSQMNVLVVEDNLMNQRYVSALLTKWGVTYQIARNGREAVDVTQRSRFDLILMDIQMPVLDGYEAARSIRTKPNPNQQVPIVALSASAMLDHQESLHAAGMNEFLGKPFYPATLLELLQKYASAKIVPTTTVIDLTVLDQQQLTNLYGDDMEYAADMFQTFLEQILPEFDAFEPLIREQQWAEVRQLAHKLKPTLRMVGLPKLEKVMARLEEMASGDPDVIDIQNLWQGFCAELTNKKPLIEAQWQHYLTS